MPMLIFDLVIFLLVVALLCLIIYTQPTVNTTAASQISKLINAKDGDWQVKQTFYCCQFIYGIFSIVFVPFNIPFLQAVLTHSAPTAYDDQGRCCKFKGPEPDEEMQEEEEQWLQQGVSLQLDGFLSNLKTTMAGQKVKFEDISNTVRNRAGAVSNKLGATQSQSGASDQEEKQAAAIENP